MENECQEEALRPENREQNGTRPYLPDKTVFLLSPQAPNEENGTNNCAQKENGIQSPMGTSLSTTVPTQLWLPSLESAKLLTAAQQRLLTAEMMRTEALETANERVKRLENEIFLIAYQMNINESYNKEKKLIENKNICLNEIDNDHTATTQTHTPRQPEKERPDSNS